MGSDQAREQILQAAMEELKGKASEVISSIMSNLYSDYLPYVETDTESNIAYRVEGCIRNMIAGEYRQFGDSMVFVSDGYGHDHIINLSSWNLTLKPLCDLMGESIVNERIKQLEDQVESLKIHLKSRSY